MILQPCNVELTKIHYYGKRRNENNAEFSGKEREQNIFNRNAIIKKNVFGQRWVLKINEDDIEEAKERKTKVVVYVLVFCSIVVAVGFGIFLSFDKRIFRNSEKYEKEFISNNSEYITNTRENMNLTLHDSTEEMAEKEMNDTSVQSNTTVHRKATFCAACNRDREVCLKIRETEKPRCVAAHDPDDPTGCGGHCQIGTHYCHVLDREAGVFQCSMLKSALECANGSFSCGNMCVAAQSRCDGVLNCSDGSDEKNCDCDLKTHFHCGNYTSCLEISKKCDQNQDCWDKSDEVNCVIELKCSRYEFSCYGDRCIPKEKFCDGSFDCADKSDEPEGCQVIDL